MAFTFKQLKQAKQNMIDFGLSPSEASRFLSSASPDAITKIIDGDMTQVFAQDQQATAYTDQTQDHDTSPQASAGDCVKDQAGKNTHAGNTSPQGAISLQDQQENKPVKDQGTRSGKKKLVSRKEHAQDQAGENIAGDCIQDMTFFDDPSKDPAHMLPAGLYDDITATIDFYCKQNGIQDPRKMHPHEWKSACIYIGQSIKTRNILQDTTRLNEGGFRYDPQKVLALLHLYDYTCGQYKQVPFEHNFARFAGVSMEYMRDYMKKGLTSSQVGLREKAHDIQTAGLIDGAAGGGSASVPMIFLCKALGGLSETVTVQHVSAAVAPQVAALPVFDDVGTLLPDNGGEK